MGRSMWRRGLPAALSAAVVAATLSGGAGPTLPASAAVGATKMLRPGRIRKSRGFLPCAATRPLAKQEVSR